MKKIFTKLAKSIKINRAHTKAFVIGTAAILCTNAAIAQDAQFSQYFSSSTYLNPSMAGLNSHFTAGSNYRTQWRTLGQPYVTQQVNASLPLGVRDNGVSYGNISFSAYSDWAGPGSIKTMGGLASLAYNLALSADGKHVLSFGLQGGMIQKSVDLSEGWGSQFVSGRGYDPTIAVPYGESNSNKMFPTIGAGLLWHYNSSGNIYHKRLGTHIGISANHLNSPDETLFDGVTNKTPRLFKAHGAYELRIGERFGIMPSAVSVYQEGLMQHNGGMYMHIKVTDSDESAMAETELSIGSMYRYQDALIFHAGLSSRYFSFAFSYDLNNSSLKANTSGQGAYEINLAIHLAKGKKAITPGAPRLQRD
jgi:type IX secretion system PorP/SprF family membrane protein